MHVVDARLRVGDAQLERPVGRVQAQLEPPAARVRHGVRDLAPAQRVREPLPARDRRRHALALQVDRDRRADRGQPGVAAGVERRVGGERGQLGQVRAQRVVDRERAVRAAERDVQVQAGDELAAGALAVLGERADVARVVGQHAQLGRERVRAGGHQAPERLGGGEPGRDGRRPATSTAVATSGHGGVTISSCEAGSSSLKRGSPSTRSSTSRALRRQVERLGVEQEQLLLDADAELVRRVEARAQRVGVHVAQPPWSRAAFGPPCHG